MRLILRGIRLAFTPLISPTTLEGKISLLFVMEIILYSIINPLEIDTFTLQTFKKRLLKGSYLENLGSKNFLNSAIHLVCFLIVQNGDRI